MKIAVTNPEDWVKLRRADYTGTFQVWNWFSLMWYVGTIAGVRLFVSAFVAGQWYFHRDGDRVLAKPGATKGDQSAMEFGDKPVPLTLRRLTALDRLEDLDASASHPAGARSRRDQPHGAVAAYGLAGRPAHQIMRRTHPQRHTGVGSARGLAQS